MSLRVSSSLLFLWALSSFDITLADKNVTVDDSDSSIVYSSGWSVSSPSNSLDYGGFHHLSSDKTSTASFTFTGTAVYIMAPLWPYAVGCQASVDGSSPVLVSMQDTSHTTDGGSEDVASAVLWGMKDLSNSSHTLQISFGDNEEFMALDAIVYTVPDANTTSSSSSSSHSSTATSSSSSASSSNTAIAASAESQTDKNHMALIAGGVGAAVVLGLIITTFCLCFSRIRRKIRHRYRRGNASAALPVTAASFVAGGTGPSRTFQGRSYASALPDSPTMESVPLPGEDYLSSSYGNANTMSNYGQANPAAAYQQYSNVNPSTNARSPFSDQPASQYSSTAYTPAMTMASVAAAATAGGPYVTTAVVDPFADHSNAAAGSSSSRSDVYTTVTTTGGSEEKARLKLAYRETDDAPPTYS